MNRCPAEIAARYRSSELGWPQSKLESRCGRGVGNSVEGRKDSEQDERMTSGMNRDSRRSPVAVRLDEQAARRLLCVLARCCPRSLLRWPRHLPLTFAARMSHVMDVA